MANVPSTSSLEQRIIVFSQAFQDLLQEIMKMKQDYDMARSEIPVLKEELAKIKTEVKYTPGIVPVESKKERIIKEG